MLPHEAHPRLRRAPWPNLLAFSLSLSGMPAHRTAEPIRFVQWFERWLDDTLDVEKAFSARAPAHAVARLRETIARVMAPARVALDDIDVPRDAEECWEALVARGVVEAETERRVFVSPCPMASSGRRKTHDGRCRTCGGNGTFVGQRPASVESALSLASMWPSIIEAEALAREFAARLAEWGPAPRSSAIIRWSPWVESPVASRSSGSRERLSLPARRELERALSLTIREDGRSKVWRRELLEVATRLAGESLSNAARAALDAELSLMLIERTQRERKDTAVDALARYTPFEPLAHLYRLGFALVGFDGGKNEIELGYCLAST